MLTPTQRLGRAKTASVVALMLTLAWPRPSAASPGPDDAIIELHLEPVADLQLAIWLEDPAGNFIADVFVTQATGKLGIGNRPGMPLFLSSWRAPYGPREGVLPVWGHRRGITYPQIIFHDMTLGDHTSQGYHETTSSPESYFCRPLTPSEDDAIVDVMSCPSPASFNSDKGRFANGGSSIYPPRNDLVGVHERDHLDIAQYGGLNELDAVTGATPAAGPLVLAYRLERDAIENPITSLVAWVEVSAERDENEHWSFDREDDHTLDESVALQDFGREFLGQPAVLYRVEFNPGETGYSVSLDYAGYADLYGKTGQLFPPDETISTSEGSGADRLQVHERFDHSGRVGVYSHGWGSAESGASTGCALGGTTLPAVEGLRLESVAFDTVRASFRVPALPSGVELADLHAAWITPATEAFELGAAKAVSGLPRPCRELAGVETNDETCVTVEPGGELSVDIDQLFGNHSYTVAMSYADPCASRSEIATAEITTEIQPFTTLDTACFVATAAWGSAWAPQLRALRWFRDTSLLGHPLGEGLVRSYYAYGPTLAALIRERDGARALTRQALGPIVDLAGALASQAD